MKAGWTTVALADVAVVERRGVNPTSLDDGTIYLGLEHIETGGRIIGRSTVGESAVASTKFQFGPQHVLFGKLRPYLAKIATPEFAGVCSTDILPIRPTSSVDRSYLTHFLRQPAIVDLAAARATGANLPRLSPAELGRFELPLPPIEEQRRIAAILDHAEGLTRYSQRAINELGRLRGSLFSHYFGVPSTWAERWRMGSIGDITAEASYGTSAKAATSGSYAVLRMGNLTYDGRLDLGDLKYMELGDEQLARYTVRRGDILFNRTNSPDLVGKTAVVTTNETMAYAGYLVRLRLTEGNTPEFVSGYLNSRHGKAVLMGMCKSIVGQANINARELQSIRIPIPQPATQLAYAQDLSAVDKQVEAAVRRQDQLGTMFKSLQARAFSGGL